MKRIAREWLLKKEELQEIGETAKKLRKDASALASELAAAMKESNEDIVEVDGVPIALENVVTISKRKTKPKGQQSADVGAADATEDNA